MKIILGMVIGVGISIMIMELKEYLKKNHLQLDWNRILKFFMICYGLYSLLGIIISKKEISPSGNICKGFNYGINICSGDINAE